jgi:hypothetical protein
MRAWIFLCLFPLLTGAAGAAGEKFALTFPVDCRLGETCVIQNFIDHDAGRGWRDHRCGALTYDGHNGTDIRLRDLAEMKRGVGVLAAADGKVLRTRDGVPDVSIRASHAPDLAGRDCGNAVMIEHADGWETQYCHLKRGSVLPLPGTRVRAGDKIGEIGLSGRTEFPHLHITVRHKGKVIDPQAPDMPPGACQTKGRSLWKNIEPASLYLDAFPLAFGFADGPVTREEVDAGGLETRVPTRQSPMIAAYISVLGLRAGDVQILSIIGPNGQILAENLLEPLDGPKAVFWLMAGRRRASEAQWPPGLYQARYTIIRDEWIVRDDRISLDW